MTVMLTPRGKGTPLLSNYSFAEALNFTAIVAKGPDKVPVTITPKIDGLGLRFGKDAEGNFFMETSNSKAIIYNGNEFVNYVIAKAAAKGVEPDALQLARAGEYKKMFDGIAASNIAKAIKPNVKLQVEVLNKTLGKDLGDTMQFIGTEYPTRELANHLTIAHIKSTNAETGANDSTVNLHALQAASDGDIKYVILQNLDKTIDVHNLKNVAVRFLNVAKETKSWAGKAGYIAGHAWTDFYMQLEKMLDGINTGIVALGTTDHEGYIYTLHEVTDLVVKLQSDKFKSYRASLRK